MRPLRQGLPLALAFGFSALILLTVAIVNGGPVVYPDSVAYLIDGERLSHLSAPYGVRAIFYGVAVWFFRGGDQFWIALALQALITTHILWLTARTVGAGMRPFTFVLLVAALVVATPLAWHVTHLLPDIFVGVMILALFLLGFRAEALNQAERAYLILLAAAAASFHLSAMPIAAVLAGVTALAWWRDRGSARPGLVALPLGLALVVSLGINAAVWQRLTLSPNSPPFLLARQLADGPARDFLHTRCGHDEFELCRYLDALPRTEEAFMWDFLNRVPTDSGKRIKAEAGAVVVGTAAMFPGRVAVNALRNGARQLVSFDSETALSAGEWTVFQRLGSGLAQATRDTLQARHWLERPNLDVANTLHAAVAALSLLTIPILLMRRDRITRDAAILLGVVLLALVVNAFVTGPVSGVFNRFEGRVIWLLPFAVAMAAPARQAHPRAARETLLQPHTGFQTAPTLR